MLLGLYVWLPVYWSKKWGPPFSGLILICINTVVRMFLIIALIIMLYQAASFYRLAHIRPWSLRETASLILIFKRRLFHKDNPWGSVRNQNRKWAKNSFFLRSFIFLSPLFLIPFPSLFCFSFFSPSLPVLISLPPSIPAGGVTVNANVENEGGWLLFVPGEGSFCYLGRHRVMGETGGVCAHTQTHRKTDILVTAVLAVTSLTTTCVPNSDAGSSWRLLLRSASDCFDNTTSRKGSSQAQRFKTTLNVGSFPLCSSSNTRSCLAALFNWPTGYRSKIFHSPGRECSLINHPHVYECVFVHFCKYHVQILKVQQ